MCQMAVGFWRGLGTDLPSEPLESLRSCPCVTHPVFRIVPVFEASPFALGRDVRGCRQVPHVQNCPSEFRRGRFGHWRRRGVCDPPGAARCPHPALPSGSPARRPGCLQSLLEAHSSPYKQLAIIWVQSSDKWAPEVFEYLYKTTTLLIKTFPTIIF